MDRIPEAVRIRLEANLEALHKYIKGLEVKQRRDITIALTGNLKDYFEYKKCLLTTKENDELGEEEKLELCEKIVARALGEVTRPKIKKSKKLRKVTKVKTDMARLLFGGNHSTCKDCGGFKCCGNK